MSSAAAEVTPFRYNDGGREEAGYLGEVGDCVTRAIAIATGVPYRQVYDDLNLLADKHERRRRSRSRTGVRRAVYERYLTALGWEWTPTMLVGSGCRVHLRPDELPSGRLILRLSKHLCAFIDGVVEDNHDPSRRGTRCVYGYWKAPAL